MSEVIYLGPSPAVDLCPANGTPQLGLVRGVTASVPVAVGRSLTDQMPAWYPQFNPVGAGSLFCENATTLARASAEEIAANQYAAKLANQFYYGTNSQKGLFHGYSGVGYNGHKEGFNTVANYESGTLPLYVMAAQAPRTSIWLVKEEGAEETLDEGAAHAVLHEAFLRGVPLPAVSEVLHGSLPSAGTDAVFAVWCPSTDELWEVRKLGTFASGAHKGELKASFGNYVAGVSTSNGVSPTGIGNSASGLVRAAGMITLADLIRVLRGGSIGHALSIAVPVVQGHLAPATRNDTSENTTVYEEDGKTANPAKGTVDAVPEGLWCAFPPASRAGEYGITKPVAVAVYEAIREYGLVVRDHGSTCAFNIEDFKSLTVGHPPVNPAAGATTPGSTDSKLQSYVNEALLAMVGSEWRDSTLPVLEEDLEGATTANVFGKQPWRTLEQLAPRSS